MPSQNNDNGNPETDESIEFKTIILEKVYSMADENHHNARATMRKNQ